VYLTDLALKNFRSHQELEASFGRGVSVILAGNGKGKTNLVEAVGYLATLSSPRTAWNRVLVRSGADSATIRARVARQSRAAVVGIEIYPGRASKARLGEAKVKPTAILGVVRAVMFTPEDLSMVRGQPLSRRQYLDDVMIQMRPSMAADLVAYEKIIQQRTALLKRLRTGEDNQTSLEVWDDQVAEVGGRIIAGRLAIVEQVNQLVAETYAALAQGTPTKLTYQTSVEIGNGTEPEEIEEALCQAMRSNREEEIARGMSLYGPHREDLELSIADLPAKGYASHGEAWSLALALKIGAFYLLKEVCQDDPILILDDVFAELDEHRRQALARVVSGTEQVLVTGAVEHDIPSELAGKRYAMKDGKIVPEGGGDG
jgi:DNA replication and repair protein RecF